MKTPHWNWLLVFVLALTLGCSQAQEPAGESEVEVAVDTLFEAWNETEDPEEQVALAREFLDRYPGNEYTGDALGAVIGPLLDDLDREDEAYALFESAMAAVTDPETKLDAQKQLAVLHSKAGRLDELDALVSALDREHEFKYTDYLDLMETAVEAEAWNLAIQQADASLALANPEAFKAQYDDISDEDAQLWGRRREAYSAAHKGWAQENLGEHDAALATFADNADKTTFTFLGADDTPLRLNWGKSLVRQGQPEQAMDILEVEALYGEHEALAAYTEAWIATRGSEEGLEGHLWSLRQEHAKPLPQFALTNYEGQLIDTDDFSDHVILVVSWSPT